MASTPQRGPGMGLPLGQLTGLNNGRVLAAGETHLLPGGQFMVFPGPYTFVQSLDPISGLWLNCSPWPGTPKYISGDQQNFRLANLTGCCVGALVTNVGSAYTSAPTVTTTGAAKFKAFQGGAISQTITVGTAGAGYNYPPNVIFSAPPAGGIPARGYATLSAGTVSAITVTDQGAGYTKAPTISILADQREASNATPGPTTVAAATCVLLATQTVVTSIVCTDPGVGAYTSAPSLTISGGGGSSAAATPIMCFAATGFTVGAGGAAYGNAQPFLVLTGGGIVPSPGAVVNASTSNNLFIPRQANITGTSTAGGAITATGLVVNDAGLFQAVPSGFVIAGGSGLATTVGQATITVGGVNDVYFVQPI
jgi:hypothetical protein